MTREFVVYGDVNLNLIDGSAIWAQSMVQVLSRVPESRVRLLLKAPENTDRLTSPLRDLPNVDVVGPFETDLLPNLSRSLSPKQVVDALSVMDEQCEIDHLVIRGERIADAVTRSGLFAGRLWTYLTDIPHSSLEMTSADAKRLEQIASGSTTLLCQTEELRSLLEVACPAAVGRTVLYPPVVPQPSSRRDGDHPCDRPLRLVYSGKFANAWRTLEMASLPRALVERDLDVVVEFIGDKIHHESDDPGFADRMAQALKAIGVIHHGGLPREDAMIAAAACDIGLSWRHESIDTNLELSTKVLEFGAIGLPVVLNRTPSHERLLGRDYPLFANTFDDVVSAIELAARDSFVYGSARDRCVRASEQFMIDEAVARVERLLRPIPGFQGTIARTTRVLVASHDLKFMTRLLDELRLDDDLSIEIDEWAALAEHDVDESLRLAQDADVIVCEWFGPNAVWYSRNKRPDQRLIVRLHRFELGSRYLHAADHGAIDQVICVNDHYRDLTRRALPGVDPGRIVTVPNWVDVESFDREKSVDARFHLGMIGIAPRRKRLDLGLDILASVRRYEPRFSLYVKTRMPWGYWWIWNDASERLHYRDQLRRIETDPLLRSSVVFDPFGPDVAAWLRKIGFVLSTSDDESFHLAPAEGMASGALPVVLPWPGAETVYAPEWVFNSVDDASSFIVEVASSAESLDELARRAKDQVGQSYRLERVVAAWKEIILGPMSATSAAT